MVTLCRLGAAVLAVAGSAAAKQYHLADTYDHTNFFDKFDFLTAADKNNGHVEYQSRENALKHGIAAVDDGEVYLGVDHKTELKGAFHQGRNSFRIESKEGYSYGLIVARFTHMPKPVCGTWPAFWTLGSSREWPNSGEIDLYEGWNLNAVNKVAFHTGSSSVYGSCVLDGVNQTSSLQTSRNCDNTFQNKDPSNLQYLNEGCTSLEQADGIWGSSTGGTQALEFTSEYIKIYNWARGQEPRDIDSDKPDTASWGMPSAHLKKSHCDIDRAFTQDQRLILDISFCGIPVQEDGIWNAAGGNCAAMTKQTCINYVSKNPGDFKDVYFKIKDIRYFDMKAPTTSSSTSASSSLSTSSAQTSTISSTESIVTSSTPSVSGVLSSKKTPSLTASANATSSEPTSLAKQQPTSSDSLSASHAATVTRSSFNGRLPSSNTSAPIAPSAEVTQGPIKMTTSVVFTTSLHTVTSCPPYIDADTCANGKYVQTVTVPLYTTICPDVRPSETLVPGIAGDKALKTITAKVTKIYTVTSCPPVQTRCPVGRVTTEVGITTIVPGGAETTAPISIPQHGINADCSGSSCHNQTFAGKTCYGVGCQNGRPFSGQGESLNKHESGVGVQKSGDKQGSQCSQFISVVPQGEAASAMTKSIAPAVSTMANTAIVPHPNASGAPKQVAKPEKCVGQDCRATVVSGASKSGINMCLVILGGAIMLL
ncbi:hypothetical protein HIM_09680 [Hirsutella minnesotensis 3608]|uniref:GH16 domain-containing protein n=1 Tax=Hirsutella minnesotensis 3608 TaxID=1043627 RepID=A0A0F8A2Z3_9HYPO|nr:hypothetical protein HIM_09680 [Hirsutella minnesotensis 3608]